MVDSDLLLTELYYKTNKQTDEQALNLEKKRHFCTSFLLMYMFLCAFMHLYANVCLFMLFYGICQRNCSVNTNMRSNPFAPGAGNPPPEFAGREMILTSIRASCIRAQSNLPCRSFMLFGLRGVGKTVLLLETAKAAKDDGHLISMIETQDGLGLAQMICPLIHETLKSLSAAEYAKDLLARGFQALKNFAANFKVKMEDIEVSFEPSLGKDLANSGDLQSDLPELFTLIGAAAKKQNKVWVLFIDEVQGLSKEDMTALLVSLHRVAQESLPVVFVGAGLPNVMRLAGAAKSYSERLFDWMPIGPLATLAAKRAIQKPLEKYGKSITEDALHYMVEKTQGYPFFLQTWAYCAWNESDESEITLEDVTSSYAMALEMLDRGFFSLRLSSVSDKDYEYVRAMASLGKGPYAVSEVSKVLGRSTTSVSRLRESLLKKGFIYSPKRGYLEFSVPMFAEYLARSENQKDLLMRPS